jgi:hypothetical protein
MHLRLDLDPDSDPVSGQLSLAGSVPRSFTGYADLIATLESIRKDKPLEPGHARRERTS